MPVETVHAWAAKAAKGPLEPFTYSPGPLAPHEVEVKVAHCGICHSDLAMLDNDWRFTKYPLVPGHEVIGTISDIGSEVTNLKIGQRVGVGWQCDSCGECEYCRVGKECFCPKEKDTIVFHHGGWASHVRAASHFAVPIPEELKSGEAGPLMCAGATVFTPMLHYGVTPTMNTAVVGIGGLGHLAVKFLRAYGCNVAAISSTHSKEAEAREFGATQVIATSDAKELKANAGKFDYIISTVSADIDWPSIINLLRPQGTLCVVGIPVSAIAIPAFLLIQGERRLVGGRLGAPSDSAKMLAFAARHNIAPKVETFKLDDVNNAVTHVRENKARYRVVLEV